MLKYNIYYAAQTLTQLIVYVIGVLKFSLYVKQKNNSMLIITCKQIIL